MSVDELDKSIQQYKAQLDQIAQALQHTKDANERQELEKLKQDLIELLELTLETLAPTSDEDNETGPPPDNRCSTAGDRMDDEFALFMKEIKQLPAEPEKSTDESVANPDTASQDELDFDGLVGSKCSAPHLHSWGSTAYHNAMVCSLDTSNLAEATAKVLFTNPTHREMIPCTYFLEGECRFVDDKCHYSHGEVVRLDQLRDYRAPRFERLRQKGSRALVKQPSRLWCKAIVLEVDFDEKRCKIRLEEGKRDQMDVAFEDLLPLDDDKECGSEDENPSDDGFSPGEDADEESLRKALMVEKSLFQPAPDRRLGEWEEYTRGIGSKIMQKMGYIVGTGLGREGEGRVLPVSAQVLPQGRSLDYCMELREQANGDKDLFSVEKKLVQLRKQQEKRDAKDYERRAKADKAKDVFAFINEQVFSGGESSKSKPTARQGELTRHDLKEHSSKNLNIASLKLSEEIRRTEADVERLKIALTRHKTGTPASDNLRRQIDAKRAEIKRLQTSEYNISKEQQLRTDKKKMTIF
ncbi:zinc finger CCCH-type with G patch domain-containing protein [Anopheles moucheti]|uniref:zinc finger CCCH-type with G patch domain-containing protein n=1 Tax=Anopheles moucheti TaxID=186751 RepID=UPI0022F0286B|nr:zinc finger CCCH-type with G patch domain-containing protein [Anopheles moucheti]XP_052895590.1 zinc finger CCCH-type with G patch domain-containing protein [Anopheles moucheti]XP_052895598.1 zinc finger CCCH-type with G patch domain-containing protein [Anopheles moucheti]